MTTVRRREAYIDVLNLVGYTGDPFATALLTAVRQTHVRLKVRTRAAELGLRSADTSALVNDLFPLGLSR